MTGPSSVFRGRWLLLAPMLAFLAACSSLPAPSVTPDPVLAAAPAAPGRPAEPQVLPAPAVPTSMRYSVTELGSMVRALRVEEVPGSPWPLGGSFRVGPAGRINWYFANVGLLPFVEVLPGEVRAYLETYLRFSRLTSGTYRIYDVEFGDPYTPAHPSLVAPDSDDAYAGTFLSLAARYVLTQRDETWFRLHRDELLAVARANITSTLKPSGLPRVYQDPGAGGGVGYLMDATEAYAGLAALGKLLGTFRDPAATEVQAAAKRVAQGIGGLFDPTRNVWRIADVSWDLGRALYPYAAAQVFPQVFEVPVGNAQETRRRYAAGWDTLNALVPDWYASTEHDDFPWVMFSLAAARAGRSDLALAHLGFVRANYPFKGGRLTINELGYYRAALAALGQP